MFNIVYYPSYSPFSPPVDLHIVHKPLSSFHKSQCRYMNVSLQIITKTETTACEHLSNATTQESGMPAEALSLLFQEELVILIQGMQ